MRLRTMGIDPGLTRMGLGVVEQEGNRLTALACDTIVTSPADSVPRRLDAVFEALSAAIGQWRPDAVAVERIFARSDVSTIMGTAQASGLAMVCAARRGIPVALHTPSEVKAAVSGNGRADKAQVGAMVTRILRLDTMPKPADAADALALAICHVWRGGSTARLDAAVEAAAAQAARQRRAFESARRTS
jgi:crossover junction endodeoxyribonuclease RuvC